MKCKNCGYKITKEELEARFRAGLGHCPNCITIDEELTEKYKRVILKPSEFEKDERIQNDSQS